MLAHDRDERREEESSDEDLHTDHCGDRLEAVELVVEDHDDEVRELRNEHEY